MARDKSAKTVKQMDNATSDPGAHGGNTLNELNTQDHSSKAESDLQHQYLSGVWDQHEEVKAN